MVAFVFIFAFILVAAWFALVFSEGGRFYVGFSFLFDFLFLLVLFRVVYVIVMFLLYSAALPFDFFIWNILILIWYTVGGEKKMLNPNQKNTSETNPKVTTEEN